MYGLVSMCCEAFRIVEVSKTSYQGMVDLEGVCMCPDDVTNVFGVY